MKKTLFFIPFFLYASILSDLKEKQLNLEYQKNEFGAKELKNSWINPLLIQFQISQNNSFEDTTQKISSFIISVNQPVFKSGAIYYSIKYANHLKKYNEYQLKIQKNELIKTALDLVYDYKINKINQEIVLLNIKNAKIDVKKKKEEFINGTTDSTFLNQAIINLNNIRLNYEDLLLNQKQIVYSFKNLSDLDIKNIKLPKFKVIEKNEFINTNLKLISSKIDKNIKYDLYKMNIGNELLTISLNLSYNWQKIKYSNPSVIYRNDEKSFYNAGITFSLPIDINFKNKIEKTKLDYLKSQYKLLDVKRELNNSYQMIISQIKTLQRKKKIYKENELAYKELIDSTIESIKAGDKTKLDLEILKNSYEIMKLNQKLVDIQIQKLLLNLYYLSIKDFFSFGK